MKQEPFLLTCLLVITCLVSGCEFLYEQPIKSWQTKFGNKTKIVVYYAEQRDEEFAFLAEFEVTRAFYKVLSEKGYDPCPGSRDLDFEPMMGFFTYTPFILEGEFKKILNEQPPQPDVACILIFTYRLDCATPFSSYDSKQRSSSGIELEFGLFDVTGRKCVLGYYSHGYSQRRTRSTGGFQSGASYAYFYVFTESEEEFIERVVSEALKNLPFIKKAEE